MNALCISAISSNAGKTILTTALLYYYKNSVRPFKIGPDFIDPLFHEKICGEKSVNLDSYIMNKSQVKWLFNNYCNDSFNILEGVMGFYDGMDKNSSAYDVTKLLKIPTLLLLDASGSYITLSAVLKGLCEYKNDNTIRAVVFNKVSSSRHYEMIKNQIEKDFSNVVCLGWIKKLDIALDSIHLGLDLNGNSKESLEELSINVLENIDLKKLKSISFVKKELNNDYPFEKQKRINKSIVIINDENFSFLYHDNVKFLEEVFAKVYFVNAIKNEEIPEVDIVYIPGGYVETSTAYDKIKDSNLFKKSLIKHAKTKVIYAECAGLVFLGNSVDKKKMLGLLDLDFTLTKRAFRIGYYDNDLNISGHAFHYTKLKKEQVGVYKLYKGDKTKATYAAYKKDKIFGTYLHTMFRNNFNKLKIFFNV